MKTLSFWTERYSRLIILKNDLERQRLSQSYLLAGLSKDIFEIAQSFAQYIHCSEGQLHSSSVEMCLICAQITKGNFVDFLTVSPSGLSKTIKMDDIIGLRSLIQTTPLVSNLRICLIQQVEHFEQAAANAFLKILEEPPDRTLWILGTSNVHKVLPTIVSRCRNVLLNVDHVRDFVSKSSEDFETIKNALFEILLALPQKKNVLKMIETFVESIKSFSEKEDTQSLSGNYNSIICDLLLMILRELRVLQSSSLKTHLIWPEKIATFESVLPFITPKLVEDMVSRILLVQKNLNYHIPLNSALIYMMNPLCECVV